MKKFFNIINRKITRGSFFTILASFIFSIAMRYTYLFLFDYFPIKGELEALDISYFFIIASFKFIFSACLEYWLKDQFTIPLFEPIGKEVLRKHITLSMVNNGSPGSTTDKSFADSSKSKSNTDNYEGIKKSVTSESLDNMTNNFHSTLKDMLQSAIELDTIKRSSNVSYSVDKNGTLSMDVPKSLSERDERIIADKVSDLDAKYIASSDRFSKLLELDQKLYNGFTTKYFKESHEKAMKKYNDLFK